jgi:hypothetical protein
VGGFVRLDQMLPDPLLDRPHLLSHSDTGIHNGPFPNRVLEDIFAELIHTLQGNEMLLIEIDQQSLEAGTILRQLRDAGWEFRLGEATTARAAIDFHLVFSNDQSQGRQLINLPLFYLLNRYFFQRCLAVGTALNRIALNPIRFRSHLQPVTGMSRLGTAFLATRLAQTTRAGWFFSPSLEGGLPELLLFLAS